VRLSCIGISFPANSVLRKASIGEAGKHESGGHNRRKLLYWFEI
jgi:hypothetical protein